MKLKVLDTFAGIGGFSLGLERTGGFETVAFCEIEPFCQKVLAKNWPNVPIYSDVRSLNAQQLRADGITVDVITGGFPCQDISVAGAGAGLAGERSGLWFELKRLIQEIKPKYVIIENVSALRSRGLDQVLRSLTEIGYDAEWNCIPASAVGAPHQRDRLWIVAYPHGQHGGSKRKISVSTERYARDELGGSGEALADTDSPRQLQPQGSEQNERGWSSNGGQEMADPGSARLPGSERLRHHLEETLGRQASASRSTSECGSDGRRPFNQWDVEPPVGRVADGVPDRSHRLKALGYAVVPQIPQLIGEAILKSEQKQ